MVENNKGDTELYNSFSLRQNELTQKYVKLQVLKDLTQSNTLVIKQKNELLKEESNSLDKLHHNVWTLQSQLCDRVWDFSQQHNFNFINSYPDIPTEFSYCNCEHKNSKTQKEHDQVQSLLKEIEKLKSELGNGNYTLLKEDLMKSESELQKYQKETPEIKKLKNDIKACEQRIILLKEKVEKKNKLSIDHNIFRQYSPDSSVSTAHSKSLNFSTLPLCKTKTQINKNCSKQKCSELNNELLSSSPQFVKASNYITSLENQRQFNNTPSCEKIVAEAVSNDKCLSTNHPRKKFVLKTKSVITQRRMH